MTDDPVFSAEIDAALTRIDNIDTDHTLKRSGEEQDAVEDLCDAFGDAVADDAVRSERYKQIASAAAENLEHLTKTQVKELLSDTLDEETGGDYPELTEFCEDRIWKIVIRRSTDHKQDVEHIIHFDDGETMEARADPGDGLAINSPGWWKSQVEVATGEKVEDPDLENIDFAEWVRRLTAGELPISTEQNTYEGPRTEAVKGIRTRVRESRAFTDLADAIADGALYIDEDAGEIFVPSGRITGMLEDKTINANELRRELVARDLDARDGSFAVTESAEVDGSRKWQDYWVFDLDALDADPAVVDPDGSDAVAAVQQAVSGGSGDDADAGDAGDDGDAGDADDDVAEQVLDALASAGGSMRADELADAVDADEEPVKAAVEQLKHRGDVFNPSNGVVELIDHRGGGGEDE